MSQPDSCSMSNHENGIREEMKSELQINSDFLSSFSLAAQQNAYPLLRNLSLHYLDLEDNLSEDRCVFKQLVVELTSDSELFAKEKWRIDEIRQGQTIRLQDKPLNISRDMLFNLTEEMKVLFTIKVYSQKAPENVLTSKDIPIDVLPANFWGGESRQPDLLAAFVKPNGVYVESLVKHVTEVLEKGGYGRSADGYQSNTREKPYLMVAALWNVIFAQRIAYVIPPQGFAHTGQRIRLADEISTSKIGACLDISLLFASCIEAMGLNPVVALTKGHAFVGVWLINKCFPVLTNDDPVDLRKRVDACDIVLFESTSVINVSANFKQAGEYARNLISEDKENEFVYVIDIKQARALKIKPLPTSEEKPKEKDADSNNELSLPTVPSLPPVEPDVRIVPETAETRIDTWQRKLLDLTKRNPLLSLKDRAVAIKLYCPNISLMEDILAKDKENIFSFLSAEKSPLNDSARSEETFRLQTGSDIHKDYAEEQINNNVLLANMSKRELEQNAVSLLRKSKNAMEEGGANTLYFALGMLRWKERSEDTRSYRAPLILIPVELIRKSAGAQIKVKQLQDEMPIFNTTLIEFLYTQYSIDLGQFKDSDNLPKDKSGVDVSLIWQTVRDAIAEQPGFEVVEELVLSYFSFTKYLMWKDIKDRIADLKNNPFVKHLVDHPQKAYVHDSSFVSTDQVDDKIDPEKVFTPLNCDSSQLVAVEASGRSQDFVLEGPPGTGKSETIANIICHNLALGRKILFVAEKMAALNVVYGRIKKIKLDHLCLELHSNKANKTNVLEQLGIAANRREEAQSEEWVETVRELKEKRDSLNSLVQALHKKSPYGWSARDAIARYVLYKDEHSLSLGWGDSHPVNSEKNLKEMLDTVELAALAYKDISHLNHSQFRILKYRKWSIAWRNQVVDCLNCYKSAMNALCNSAEILASDFNIRLPDNSIVNLDRINSLVALIEFAESNSLSYIVAKDARDLLKILDELSTTKKEFDEILNFVGHNVSPEILANSPVVEWVDDYKSTKDNWFKRIFAKLRINSTAKKLGYRKFKCLDVLLDIEKGFNLQEKIKELAIPFKEDKIWHGWDTTPESLSAAFCRGKTAYDALSDIKNLSEDPAMVHAAVKSELIDGRDSLDNSNVVNHKNKFKRCWSAYKSVVEESEKLKLEFDENSSFEEVEISINNLIEKAPNFQAWSYWLENKEALDGYKLSSLTEGLEAGTILPEDAKEQVLTGFCQWIAERLVDESDILREFNTSRHELLIKKFRQLDADVLKTTSDYVAAVAAQKVPDPFAEDSPEEFGVLARELQKKTRHKPIRLLFNEMGERLLELCPCMMMSPLSVAQFLPSDFNGFDLVVFDEASQMTTWDSVGAIARGKNVIVVGDPKQMPPTSFFSGVVDADDPDEEDLESILDQALAARLTHIRLKGHYRSRHETLIAFSNSKYYENSLVTYPSSDTKKSAVKLYRVDGIYSRGRGRNNPVEAAAVVKEIIKRLTDPKRSHQSIGVVTLNTEQQRTIEDLLDYERRKNSEMETYFQSTDTYDGVFVKNLESVQGDERDIIILSLGYGPTEVSGRTMSMNFGPLNKSGGHRRLNVAITRAKSEVLLFSSFDASMIDLSRTSALAVGHLKHYLEFAEKGPSALAEQSTADYGVDQFDSDFEQAVAWALRAKGWRVQTQIGVSKFRVDLGIIHSDRSGVYLAGIECDGATYHGSPSARDRDIVRHRILENLGWRLVRLWSTDYFQDPEGAIEKIDRRLKEILEEDRLKEDRSSIESEQDEKIVSSEISSQGETSKIDSFTSNTDDAQKEVRAERGVPTSNR